jgi:hypothetical protein
MWDGSSWVLMATYNNAIDPRPKKASQNLVTSGGVFDNMGALDVSELNATENPHTPAIYADLSAAIAAISTDYQKGGMSIKFVQSSDNKYVQARLMSNEFTTDTTQWTIADEGVYVENPEFIYVKTDKNNKILWAIRTDGSIYYGAGVPQQVKDYINEKIVELSLDEYEDIVAFLDGIINKQPIFTNKKVSIIGDSISTFTGYIPDGYPSWYPHENDRSSDVVSVNDTWWKKLIDATNSTLVVNASASGSTASNDYIGFSPRVSMLGNSDVIIVALGTNDSGRSIPIGNIDFNAESYDLSQFAPAYIKGIKDTIASHPYARIICLAFDMGTEYQNAIKTIAGHYNLEYIYVGDISDVHPNKAEMQAVYEKIYNTYTLSGLLANKVDKEEGKSLIPAQYVQEVENPEFIKAELDAEQKLLGGIKKDGTYWFNKVESPTLGDYVDKEEGKGLINSEYAESVDVIEDPEGRHEVTTDSEGRIISYRKEDGTKVENVGIETNHLELTEQGMTDFQQSLKDSGFNPEAPTKARQYHLPKYGRVNIKSETFYLTSDSRYSDKDGIYLIQDWEDTDENAANSTTLSNFYIKSTLISNGDGTYSKYNDGVDGHDVKLDFYAANKVTKVGSLYYVTDTLVDGQVVDTSVEVTQIVDTPQYKAWPVEKDSEHYCIVDIDFGYFMTKTNVPLGMKYQGQSTIKKRKRNFRVTFYKKNDFKKKDKKKIGELVRLSGFNLKANWSDNSRIKEAILYRIFIDIWNKRVITDRFPWDKEFGYYTGATGFINGFPMRLEFGGDFYGLDIFALKKDEKNYMLDGDDDASGIFLCGAQRNATHWKHGSVSGWEDEMMDEMSPETSTALYNFLRFISTMFEGSDGNPYRWHELTYFVGDTAYDYSKVGNKGDKIYLYPEYGEDEITAIYVTSSLVDGVPTENSISAEFVGLNESEIEERMDIQGWMDYFICMQTFLMWDSICRNVILHTRSDKKKFYPYLYDLDLSLNREYNADIFDIAYDTIDGHRRTNDMTLWENLKDIYWDQIVNRYCELRNTVLNTEYITALYHDLADSIPDADYADENQKWGKSTGRGVFEGILDKIDKRLAWLDENYFIV